MLNIQIYKSNIFLNLGSQKDYVNALLFVTFFAVHQVDSGISTIFLLISTYASYNMGKGDLSYVHFKSAALFPVLFLWDIKCAVGEGNNVNQITKNGLC